MTDPEGKPLTSTLIRESLRQPQGRGARENPTDAEERCTGQGRLRALLAAAVPGESCVKRSQPRRDGQLVTVEASVSPVLDAQKRRIGFIAVQHDVTERKVSEEALRKSEQGFSLVFHASPIPTSISEIETGQLLDVNEQFLRILGYSREEVLGKTARELGIWTDPGVRDRVGAHLGQGPIRDQVICIRTRSGMVRDVVESAVPIDLGGLKCVLWTFLDITERLSAEKELRRSQERFQRLFDSSTIGITIADLAGHIREANDAYLKMIGYSREEVLSGGIRWDKITPLNTASGTRPRSRSCAEPEQPSPGRRSTSARTDRAFQS